MSCVEVGYAVIPSAEDYVVVVSTSPGLFPLRPLTLELLGATEQKRVAHDSTSIREQRMRIARQLMAQI